MFLNQTILNDFRCYDSYSLLHSSSGQLGVVIMCDKCTDYSKTEDNDDIPISHRKSMPYTLASMQPLVQNF